MDSNPTGFYGKLTDLASENKSKLFFSPMLPSIRILISNLDMVPVGRVPTCSQWELHVLFVAGKRTDGLKYALPTINPNTLDDN